MTQLFSKMFEVFYIYYIMVEQRHSISKTQMENYNGILIQDDIQFIFACLYGTRNVGIFPKE